MVGDVFKRGSCIRGVAPILPRIVDHLTLDGVLYVSYSILAQTISQPMVTDAEERADIAAAGCSAHTEPMITLTEERVDSASAGCSATHSGNTALSEECDDLAAAGCSATHFGNTSAESPELAPTRRQSRKRKMSSVPLSRGEIEEQLNEPFFMGFEDIERREGDDGIKTVRLAEYHKHYVELIALCHDGLCTLKAATTSLGAATNFYDDPPDTKLAKFLRKRMATAQRIWGVA